MSCRISIITPEQLYEWVDLALNVDADKITRCIIIAQDRYVKPILCVDLFNELLTQIESGTVTPDFQDLIDSIIPYLSFRAYSRYLNGANIDSTEKGLRTWNEDNSTVITDRRLGELMPQADQDALTYENDLKIFLTKNKECFSPFYDNCGCDSSSSGGFKITSIGRDARKPSIQEIVNNNLLDHQ
jgi:hypothetical protein